MESTIDDDDDDESVLLALDENIRATDKCSKELELSKKRTHQPSVSSTQKPTEILKNECNLETASASCHEESIEIPKQIAENLKAVQEQLNIKKPRKYLHDILMKTQLSAENSAFSVKSKEKLPAEKLHRNSNKNTKHGKSQNESIINLEEFFNWLSEIDKKKNIDVESDIDDELLLDLADKMVLNTLECEKFEREYQIDKKIKQEHNSSQSTSFDSRERNLEDIKKVELLNHVYVQELLVDGSKSEGELTEDDFIKARREILTKQAFLEKFEGSVQKALERNIQLQEYLSEPFKWEEGFKKSVRPWNVFSKVIFGMRYFKEKNRTMSCPPNADASSLIERGLPLGPFRDDSGVWTTKESKQLMTSVEEILRGRIADELGTKKNSKAISLVELMSKASINDDYDWGVISTNTYSGFRSPDECKCQFKMILDPTLNQRKWSQQEEEKLSLLADRHSYQDWDAIAIVLGTNRSAYQCCVHFQTEMSTTVRSFGKWSREEDDKLIEAVSRYPGGKNIPWSLITYSVNSRSMTQMRSRWIEALAPHRKKGRFSTEEDRLLFRAVEQYGQNFKLVAAMFPNRTLCQVKNRFRSKTNDSAVKGHWSLEEDKTLMKLVNEIGVGNWKEISDHFITRTRTQIRQRYNHIKTLLDEYPKLAIEEIYRPRKKTRKHSKKNHKVEPNKRNDEVEDKSEVIVSNSSDSLNKSIEEGTDESELPKNVTYNKRSKKRKSEVTAEVVMPPAKQTKTSDEVTNEDHVTVLPEDAPCTRTTRKRKPEVVDVGATMPPPKQIITAAAASNNEDQRRYDRILRSINQKPYQKTAAGKKLVAYFQETYPMQAVVSKKVWDESDISAQAKLIFDLSHILRVDFSFIDDSNRLKSLRPPLLKQIVNRMIENHGDELLRLNPLTIDDQSNAESEGATGPSDTNFISPIDYVPVPIEETLCPDPLPEDFDEKSDDYLFPSSQNKEAERQKLKHMQLVKDKKRKFMDFEFLVPPNIATAVGYRSLLLVERKLKEAEPPDEPPSSLPPDYTSTEFRMREIFEPLPYVAPKCDVRFTKQEAVQMFRERLKALFAGPIVMGECADRYFNVNNLPGYKQESTSKYKRRTTAVRNKEIQDAKLSSTTQKLDEDVHIELQATETTNSSAAQELAENVQIELETTETPYSMPNLASMENGASPLPLLEGSHITASSSVNNCPAGASSSNLCKSNSSRVDKRKCPVKAKISTTKMIDFSQPFISKSTACNPRPACKVNNCNPSTSISSLNESNLSPVKKRKCPVNKGKTKNSATKMIDSSLPTTSKSTACKPSACEIDNRNLSTSTSSLSESNSSPVNKRKCPVKAKISATKTIDFDQPTTLKRTACQPSTASKVNNCNPSTMTPNSKPSVQKKVSRKRPRSNLQTTKPNK